MSMIPAQWTRKKEKFWLYVNSRLEPVGRSLRAKIAAGIILPLVFTLTAFSIYEVNRDRSRMLNDLSLVASETGDIIEATLHEEMLESDFEGIQNILDAFYAGGSFKHLYILNTSGEVIFAPQGEGVGTVLDNNAQDCQPCHQFPVEERPNSIVVETDNGEFIFRSMKPLFNEPECAECHDDSERIRGLLLNDISINPYTDILITDFREQMIKGTTIIVLSVVIVYFSINRFVLRGIDRLASDMAYFAKGHRPAQQNNNSEDEIGRLAVAFGTMADEVEARYKENTELTEKLNHQSALRGKLLSRLITSQEDERNRLARDLHDEFGQALGGLALKTESISKLVEANPTLANRELGNMSKLIHTTTEKMYEMIKVLRPSLLDDLGLIPAIKDHARRALENTKIDFTLNHADFDQCLPRDLEVTIYRVFQEAIHNIVKHAGAKQINARFICADDLFKFEISDDGRGFDIDKYSSFHQNGHFGLLGMHERISLCGGSLDIASTLGKGTTLVVKIPIMKADHE